MERQDLHPRTLEQDVEARIPKIQDLFAAVLESSCGEGDAPITTICDRLGIHRKLAWQVRNVAYSPDPFRAVRFMPTRAGLETLADAMLELGAAPDLATNLRGAGEAFDSLVQAHAGDRTLLDMLVEARTVEPEDESDLKWRERAFQGNSFIWGAQARTQLSTSILMFSQDRADWFDQAQIRGLIGLKRVRPNVKWLVGQSVVLDGRSPDRQPRREPLDPAAASRMGGVPILPDFCSNPLPELERRPAEQGLVNDELLPAPVGTIGQQTVVTGEVIRELAPVHATNENRRALFGAVVRTPSEVFVYDQFVQAGLFPGVERELCVFSELNSPVAQSESDRLPVNASIEHRGRGFGAARCADVPGYLPMLRDLFGRLDLNAQDFDLYRVRLAYPPMPASVVIRHDLPGA